MRSLRALAVAAVVPAPAMHARQSNEFQPVTTQMLVNPDPEDGRRRKEGAT